MKTDRRTLLRIVIAAFALFLCIYYWDTAAGILSLLFSAAFPLLIGFGIAYAVNITMSFYERHYFPRSGNAALRKSARPVCMLAAYLTVVLILAAVIALVVPELVECVGLLLDEVPAAIERLLASVPSDVAIPEAVTDWLDGIDLSSVLSKVLQTLTTGVGGIVNTAAGVISPIANAVIGLIFSFYFLASKERLLAQGNRLLKCYLRPKWNQKLHYVLSVADGCFHRYIVGQCAEACILGVLCALGMLIFGFPYAVMTGAVVGVTALIPIAGAYIGGAVGFLMILTVDPLKAVLFVVFLVVLQQLEGDLIYPRVVGSSLGLPAVWVLAAVTIGGSVYGIVGMLLGVPLAATLYQLIRENTKKKEARIAQPPQHPETD